MRPFLVHLSDWPVCCCMPFSGAVIGTGGVGEGVRRSVMALVVGSELLNNMLMGMYTRHLMPRQ